MNFRSSNTSVQVKEITVHLNSWRLAVLAVRLGYTPLQHFALRPVPEGSPHPLAPASLVGKVVRKWRWSVLLLARPPCSLHSHSPRRHRAPTAFPQELLGEARGNPGTWQDAGSPANFFDNFEPTL